MSDSYDTDLYGGMSLPHIFVIPFIIFFFLDLYGVDESDYALTTDDLKNEYEVPTSAPSQPKKNSEPEIQKSTSAPNPATISTTPTIKQDSAAPTGSPRDDSLLKPQPIPTSMDSSHRNGSVPKPAGSSYSSQVAQQFQAYSQTSNQERGPYMGSATTEPAGSQDRAERAVRPSEMRDEG